ncbi:MAG TPA: hypothetical protein VGQ89_16825 [Candidatus Limnocylindrales bacterium]|nr:hypothetical protein [Candidatus Limnocylindrales bacterium]
MRKQDVAGQIAVNELVGGGRRPQPIHKLGHIWDVSIRSVRGVAPGHSVAGRPWIGALVEEGRTVERLNSPMEATTDLDDVDPTPLLVLTDKDGPCCPSVDDDGAIDGSYGKRQAESVSRLGR